MRVLGTTFLLIASVVAPSTVFAREEPKVSMEDVLKEIVKMRQELRELKIQRDRDQRVIDELRRIVENGLPDLPMDGPQPATAAARASGLKPGLQPAGLDAAMLKPVPSNVGARAARRPEAIH